MASAKKPIPMAVIVLALVAVLGAAGFMGFSLWRDYQLSERDDEEQHQREGADPQPQRVKKPKQPVEIVAAPVDAGVPEQDDLGNLPKGSPKKVASAVKAPSGTAAQRAFQGFKAAYDKLEAANEGTAKKFRVQRLRLEDQLGNGTPPNEAKFIADCGALRQQILEALRNPENQ